MYTKWNQIQQTFRDEEAGCVEGGSNGWGGVDHAWFVYPFKRAFLWVPLNGVEWVSISCNKN